MIDGGKLNAAISILSTLPSVDPTITVVESESTYRVINLEYEQYAIQIKIEYGAADPYPYLYLLSHANYLFKYFVDRSVQQENKLNELLLAFNVTFNSLIAENEELRQRIAQLEGEL